MALQQIRANSQLLAPGHMVNFSRTETTAQQSISSGTFWPMDGTIPQITEGGQVLSLSVTPKASTNILLVESVLFLGQNGGYPVNSALFRSDQSNSIGMSDSFNYSYDVTMARFVSATTTAGTTSSLTISVRVSTTGYAMSVGVNQDMHTGTYHFGAAWKSYLQVTEIAA